MNIQPKAIKKSTDVSKKLTKSFPRVTRKKSVKSKLQSIPRIQYGKDPKTGKKYQIGV